MADPLSVAAGAIGVASLAIQLLGGCVQGFVLLSTARNFGRDASTIVCMLNIQEIQLSNWALKAGLLSGDGTLDKRLNSSAVEAILRQLRDLLLDAAKLKNRFGLSLIQKDDREYENVDKMRALTLEAEQQVTTHVLRTRTHILARAGLSASPGLLKKAWWAAVDKDKIYKLVTDIRSFVQELWNLLDACHNDDVLRSTETIARNIIALNDKYENLVNLKEVFETFLYRMPESSSAEIRNLITTTEVKAVRVALDDEGTENNNTTTGETSNSKPRQLDLVKNLERLVADRLTSFKAISKSQDMGTALYDGHKVFVERKQINSALRSKLLPRAEKLAVLLHVPKPSSHFRALHCRGIVERDGEVSFVFDIPCPDRDVAPFTLIDLFSKRSGITTPSLNQRIRLALSIVQSVQSFHATGWLHKSLRSENMVLFPLSKDLISALEDEPWLSGFAFSRFGSPTEISEQPSADPKRDVYRHPDAMGEPTVSFNEIHDIYALGIILLEIAEWCPLRYLVDEVVDVAADDVPFTALSRVREFLVSGQGKRGTTRLGAKMGDIYTAACMACLSGDVSYVNGASQESARESDELQNPSLLDKVVQQLRSCRI